MAKRWIVVDTKDGDWFTTILPADATKEDAYKELRKQWDRLTKSEQEHREDFFVGTSEVNEDGDIEEFNFDDIIYPAYWVDMNENGFEFRACGNNEWIFDKTWSEIGSYDGDPQLEDKVESAVLDFFGFVPEYEIG